MILFKGILRKKNTDWSDLKPFYSHNQARNVIPLAENILASGRTPRIKPWQLISLMTPFSYFSRCHFSIVVNSTFSPEVAVRSSPLLRGNYAQTTRWQIKAVGWISAPCRALAGQGQEEACGCHCGPHLNLPERELVRSLPRWGKLRNQPLEICQHRTENR